MTGQHKPLWKPEVESGAPEGWAFPAPRAVPVIVFPMSYQGRKRTYDNNIMAYRQVYNFDSERMSNITM